MPSGLPSVAHVVPSSGLHALVNWRHWPPRMLRVSASESPGDEEEVVVVVTWPLPVVVAFGESDMIDTTAGTIGAGTAEPPAHAFTSVSVSLVSTEQICE